MELHTFLINILLLTSYLLIDYLLLLIDYFSINKFIKFDKAFFTKGYEKQ